MNLDQKNIYADIVSQTTKLEQIGSRIETLTRGCGAPWEIEYWVDEEVRELDRISRDRVGNLAYRNLPTCVLGGSSR